MDDKTIEMNKDGEIIEINKEKGKGIVEFKKPYFFEGKQYTEIDLNGIEDLTVKDLTNADKQFATSGNIAAMNEMNLLYACIVASKVTGKPIEFFENLPGNEGLKIKGEVMRFFYA